MTAVREKSETQPTNPLRSWLVLTVILMLAVLAAAGVKSYGDLAASRALEADLQCRVEAASERIKILDQRLDGMSSDPGVLERLAREELGMVYPDDIVIVLPEEPPRQPAPPQS